jgi:FOG: PKD repeat
MAAASFLRTLHQSTYLGGNGGDGAHAIAIHPKTGEVYVAGYTGSTHFPETFGGAQASYGGAFVARLSADLRTLHQSTYLGGSKSDTAYALAIHPATGEVYVAGRTYSTDFPKTAGGAQTNCNNCAGGTLPIYDAFVARLNSDLTQILQSTYLGGRERDDADAIAIHPKTGEVYVAGYTESTDFPNTSGRAQTGKEKDRDAFVARLNSDLTQILQATYLGGRSGDEAKALAIHPISGEVYVAGYTYSTNFPNTSGGAQARMAGSVSYPDAFVARLNPDLTQILQATYLGGDYWDEAKALAIHPKTGEVYVAGYTDSTNFPNTSGGAQANFNGSFSDAFVARLNSGLTQILQATYLGGSDTDRA